ncbi:MAG TPA: phage tail tape measure protein, partial [Myxococcales bacterium]|nr:phage tail tape measure protein [Myxococcales bacterium]
MALNNLGLGFVFTARDLASAKMARLERRFSSLDDRVSAGTARMSTAFRQLGVGLAVFTAGAAVVAGSFALANAAGRFEQGIAAVGAVTRATTDQLRLLREAAINAGIETQFSPEEAVEGLQSLATAGQTAEQATRTLVPVLDLAAGSLGQLGVAQAAEAVVGTLNAYGFSADQAASVTDRLLRITQLTNFQTRDFEGGLAKAAAAGSVFGQELNDVLITMGLLRNRNIDASSSSTAFREAVRRLGSDSRAQQAVLGAGVQVFDQQTGSMRSVVDIMVDFADATRGMTDEERNRRVATAFGARGLLAFNAILNASFTTMQDGRQVTLQGAEAIAAMRREMADAEGTAQGFRDQLLDTFEGQKTLLRGTLQTFAVVLGEPFAAVFKPIVRAVVGALNALLRAFQAIPAPIKKIFAGLVVGAGAFLTLVGGVIAAKAAIALLAIGFKALGITLGGVLATLLPAILIIAVLGTIVAGFVIAFQRNLGGIGDFMRRTWARVRLFFQGLTQLFEQGGFSGAVREELDRAENQGLKR